MSASDFPSNGNIDPRIANPGVPVTPHFGMVSVGIVVTFTVLVACLGQSAWSETGGRTSFPSDKIQRLFMVQRAIVGVVFGITSSIMWMTSWCRGAWAKYAVQAIVVVVAAAILNQLGTYGWPRNLSNAGGFCLFQCILFFFFGVPAWSTAGRSAASVDGLRAEAPLSEIRPSPTRSRQYRISDIVMATTCSAGLLALVRAYDTPVEATDYWIVTTSIWTIGPILAACVNFSFLDRRRLRRVVLAIVSLMIAIAGGFGLAWAQAMTDGGGVTVPVAAPFYLSFMFGFLISLAVVAFAGAYQANLAKLKSG